MKSDVPLPVVAFVTQFAASRNIPPLVLLGAVIIGSGLLYGIVRLVWRGAQAGAFSVLLALGGSVSILIGFFRNSLNAMPSTPAMLLAFIVSTACFTSGIGMWLRERTFENFQSSRSFGLLYIGVSVFVAVIAVVLPTIPMQFSVASQAGRAVSATPTPTRTLPPTRTPLATNTPTPVPSLTLTPTPLPTLTITPSRQPITLPTRVIPSATPTTTQSPCVVTASDRLNLRAQPSTGSTVVTVLDPGTALNADARSADGQWWRVRVGDQSGWVNAGFVTALPACDSLPTVAP